MGLQLESVACNFCGASVQRQRFQKKGHLTGETFSIVQCQRCGLVFVNPRLTAAAIKDLYGQAYFEGQGFDPTVGLEADAQRLEGATRALERICAVQAPPSGLLEVGPGGGHLLKAAQMAGFRASGLELSDYAADRLRRQGLDVIQGTIDQASLPNGPFDVVVAIEVIEHVPDPKAFLKQVARILRPGGLFYYETGDIDCEQARREGVNWEYIKPEGHLYYFSPRTLTQYLQECGFTAVYPLWFNPTRRIARILERFALLTREKPVLEGKRGALARWVLAAWDWAPSRRPYPMAIRRHNVRVTWPQASTVIRSWSERDCAEPQEDPRVQDDWDEKLRSAAWRPAADLARPFVRYPHPNRSPALIWREAPREGAVAVTVVIPTSDADRQGYFVQLLGQLSRQTLGRYELIVVRGDPRQGRAINIAAAIAQGKYLWVLDDDTSLPDPTALSKLLAVLEGHLDIGVVGGNNVVPPQASAFVQRVMRQLPRRSWEPVREITDSDLAEHPCLMMRTEEFKAVGGENELLPRGLDPYLRQVFRERGMRVVLAPGVIYSHLPPAAWKPLLRQFVRNGRHAAFVNRRYPQWVFETPSDHRMVRLRVPAWWRVVRFPIHILRAVLTGKPVWAICEIAYAIGFLQERWFPRERF